MDKLTKQLAAAMRDALLDIRNGHGAGFWDRTELDADELGDRLTVLAKEFGAVDLYQGDDRLLYLA